MDVVFDIVDGRFRRFVCYRTVAAIRPGKAGWSMAERVDRRAARTRKALTEALLSLILSKGYEEVSVQDIIDEADVGRSTFYAHYTGKEDLLRSSFQQLRGELRETQTGAGKARPAAPGGLLSFSTAMFEHAARYTDHYRTLVGGRGGAVADQEIRQILSVMVRVELPPFVDEAAISRELAVQLVVGAFMTVLGWWLERKPKLPPAEIDGMFRRFVLKGIGPQIDADKVDR
jgi:AcrR family transcriptional regulator